MVQAVAVDRVGRAAEGEVPFEEVGVEGFGGVIGRGRAGEFCCFPDCGGESVIESREKCALTGRGRLTYTTDRGGLCAELGSRHGWLLVPSSTLCVDFGVSVTRDAFPRCRVQSLGWLRMVPRVDDTG